MIHAKYSNDDTLNYGLTLKINKIIIACSISRKLFRKQSKTDTDWCPFIIENNGAIHGIQTHDLSITNLK
jgi:hypothetical protein